MSYFWTHWRKPWTKEQCARRLIEGTSLKLSELAANSGIALGTIKRWAAAESWLYQRTMRDTQVSAISIQKVLRGSDLEGNDLAAEILNELITNVRNLHKLHNDRLQAARESRVDDFVGESRQLLSSAEMLYKLQGLKYQDVSVAIAYLASLGYQVILPGYGEQPDIDTPLLEVE